MSYTMLLELVHVGQCFNPSQSKRPLKENALHFHLTTKLGFEKDAVGVNLCLEFAIGLKSSKDVQMCMMQSRSRPEWKLLYYEHLGCAVQTQ